MATTILNGFKDTWSIAGKRLKAYAELTKFRLASLVVFSAVMSYLLAVPTINIYHVLILSLAGFLVTGASNAINQIIEKDFDKLMHRTAKRPLPAGIMTITEASLLAGIMGVGGVCLLAIYFNVLSGLLGAIALLSYAFIYTPFKRISPAAVFMGAVPGSIPLLIGWTAATGELGFGGYVLFLIQFFWQIPHFWAIAWVLDDDYKRGGYSLLPNNNKSRETALQNLPYLLILMGVSALPYLLGYTGVISLVICLVCGVYYLLQGLQLSIDLTDKSAKKLMFASFIYLPVVFLSLVLDKI